MSRTNVLPNQSLKQVSCPTLVCLLLLERTALGHVRFESSCPSHVCPSKPSMCSRIFFHPSKRPHSRPDNSAHVCRKAEEERNEARAKRAAANRGRRTKKQNGDIKRREHGPWKIIERVGARYTDKTVFVSVAAKTNDDCDKHFGASAFRPIRMKQSRREENARFHFLKELPTRVRFALNLERHEVRAHVERGLLHSFLVSWE